jgi:N-acetylglucosaminyldiphosphoundecaprenol N-acetyl-beta-D-mannosaminyltransferase
MAVAAPRAHVLGFGVDRLTLEGTVERCRRLASEGRTSHHVSLNAAKIVSARDNERLATILREADLVSADGQSVVWAARLLRDPLPERVAGIDLMHRLLEIAEADELGVFFLGARDAVLDAAVASVRREHPRLRISGRHNGYFEDGESGRVCELVNGSEASILFVAMSSPKKEYWVHEHRDALRVPLVVGVGGALDVLAGCVSRAPRWVQRAGLEWAYRLGQEPRRLWRRYLVGNVRFARLLIEALARRDAA